jgi:hypothetical protein
MRTLVVCLTAIVMGFVAPGSQVAKAFGAQNRSLTPAGGPGAQRQQRCLSATGRELSRYIVQDRWLVPL